MGILLLEADDQLLDLHRQLVGVPIRSSTAVGQAIDAAVLVAVVDLEAGLAGDAELTAERRHLLAIEITGDESETFFHDIPLLPGHDSLPNGRKCYPVSGMECYPSLGKSTLTINQL